MLFVLAVACSRLPAGGGPASTPAPTNTSNSVRSTNEASSIECRSVALGSDSAGPGELVAIEGLPPALAPTAAYASIDPSGTGDTLPVLEADGQPVLMAPFHPNGVAGGELELTVWVGSTHCGQVRLQVSPIAATDGAFAAYVDSLQEYMGLLRRLYDVSREQLLTGSSEPLPPYLLPLAFAQRLTDGPQVENSLRALADGTAPMTHDPAYDLDLLNAAVVQLGLAEQVAQEIEAMQERLGENGAMGVARGAMPLPQAVSGSITTAALLDKAMRDQAMCEGRFEGAIGKLTHDLVASTRAVLGGAARFIPGPSRYVTSAAIFATQAPGYACEYLLPSRFTVMTAEGSILWFPDEWAGGPGAVTQTSVVAVSKELDLEAQVEELTAGMEAGAPRDQLRQLTQDLCAQFEACGPDGSLGPIEYGPIDVTGTQWTEAEPVNEVISVGELSDVYIYQPQTIGVGGVRIRTRPEHFADAAPALAVLEVRVADCVDTGVRPPETSYQFQEPDYQVTCTTPRGSGTVPVQGAQYSAQLSWSDEYACMIHVSVGPVQYLAARVLATETVSVYQGVVLHGPTTCGVTMSWDDSSQGFLGELRCWAFDATGICRAGYGFSMKP
jgi:hypothetical protein